jgi:DNA mismatch repair protein MSH4
MNCTGLELARLADLPSDVTLEAKRIATLLKKQEEERRIASTSSQVAVRRKALLTVCLSMF